LKRPALLVGSAWPAGEQGSVMQIVVALSWRGDKRDSNAELLRHEIMDDVQAEPDTALRTSGSEEGYRKRDAGPLPETPLPSSEKVISTCSFAEATRLDQHVSAGSVGEGVR